MTLRQKRVLFTRLLPQVINYVFDHGWEIAIGEVLRPDRAGHKLNSLHYDGLAADFALYINGEWIKDGGHSAWRQIGIYWEGLHPLCRAGFRFGDDNHLSVTDDGRE